MYYVYILRTVSNKLYIGQTNNLSRRLGEHSQHKGAKFLQNDHTSLRLVYSETFSSQVEAIQREKQLKGWSRAKKEALIMGDMENLKLL